MILLGIWRGCLHRSAESQSWTDGPWMVCTDCGERLYRLAPALERGER